MNWNKIFALSLRHIYLIKGSFPRILDLIYWPTIQIFLWGFISKFFTLSSSYYNNTVGVILSAAILYDFLFRSSISYNMMFLEEIWSRNFTNLFIAPIKISEIIAALTFTAIIRTLIGMVPAAIIAIPLSLLLGITAALYRNSIYDRTVNASALTTISMPEFFVAYILIIYLASINQFFPSLSNVTSSTPFFERIYLSVLPALTLTLVTVAHMMRMTRASIINLLSSPYIEMARLKGISKTQVIIKLLCQMPGPP